MQIKNSILALIFCQALIVSAQQNQGGHCGTDEFYHEWLKNHPEAAEQERLYNEQAKQMAPELERRAAIYTIPVVFHVIHTNGPENISREQIVDQLRVLNQDFNFLNPNRTKIRSQFTAVAADCQIQFKLANIAPDGSCTDGINRVYSSFGVEVDQQDQKVKSLVQWDYTKYLNIWVVTSIKSSGNGIILGYAAFPWMMNTTGDGIVVRHDRVGTIGTAIPSDSGRTLTHEIGHWLNLLHTFQDGCTGGDQIDDTPPVASTFTNANCPANGNSCSNDVPNLPDQWENYMDYSEGSCMAMFTIKQKARMTAALNQSPRKNNISAANLIATGVTPGSVAPLASFSSSHRIVCAGQPVTFYDQSCKAAVTARSWTLTGSSSPSSSAANPTVVYQTPGKYAVSLTVQNSKGSNTKSVTDYIEVLSKISPNYPNLEEGFESDPAPRGYLPLSPAPDVWKTTSQSDYNGITFVPYKDNQCFKAPVSSSDNPGKVYSFRTPAVDLSKLRGLSSRITFYCAYAPTNTTTSEILRLYASTDCGNSYRQILERSGTGLGYIGAPPSTTNFVPTQKSHWRLQGNTSLGSISLDTFKNVIFRVDVISDAGNPVYIDNLNISQWFAGTDNPANDLGIRLYPNPAAEKATLELNVKSQDVYEVDLIDVQGRIVSHIANEKLGVGTKIINIEKNKLPTGSLYILRIKSSSGSVTKPFSFAP